MERPSSSSKVTVEYFDPYGVYQLLSPGLLPRLPLRNLHWESHAGPLRSISSLHVDLVPSAAQVAPLSSTDSASASNTSLARVKSEDSGTSGDDGFRTQALGQAAVERPDSRSGPPKPLVKERRHQIPGLRQTPYLKVFFLRCDDNETYKMQARRQVREWIKEHTTPVQSTTKANAQENHDAFEWLIVHIIVPNTAAATQPRTSGKNAERSSGSNSEKSAAARWRGGGSSTILEKLRADFNGSSKSAVDRVAQIRIGINDVPYEMLPRVVPAIPGSYHETPQENEVAWVDLLSKFKLLILASFDMRVGQYEEDIREKDAQRSLPGWNFCTFFVLKEGLARGFESVGLVKDALVGYDELAVGLDAIIREQTSTGGGAEHGGSFLPYTEDLTRQVEKARNALLRDGGAEAETDDPIDLQSGTTSANEADEIPLNALKKRYRELILSNDISIFDFRCYLFARQLSLLLRLANAWSSQEELIAKLKEQRESTLLGVAARLPASQPSEETENLAILGEICKRSMDFIASIARIMRDDIHASQIPLKQRTDDEEGEVPYQMDPIMVQAVDNMVASLTFSIAQQILAQTSTKSLPIPPSTLAPPSGKIGSDGQEPKAAIPEPKTMMHPARSSSLAKRSSPREPPSPGIFPGGRRSSVPDASTSSSFLKPGLEQLAAHRAELYLLSRDVLEQVGKKRGWSVGWSEISHLQDSKADDMKDVDLNAPTPAEKDDSMEAREVLSSSHGIGSKLLWTALDNKEDFYRLYETLTDKALRHFTVANHIQSVQSSMTDLAVLKYYLKDYAAAASYFYRMTPFYGDSGWAEIELSMLVLYADCLKQLQRKEEYVRVVLKLLSKAAVVANERIRSKSAFKFGHINSFNDESIIPTEPYLEELLPITKLLQHEVQVPLQNFFGHVEVDGTPKYHPEKDSYALQIRLRYLLREELTIEKAKVKISPVGSETNKDLWLETEGTVLMKPGIVTFIVQSNVIIPGTYLVNYISLYTSNIVMQYVHDNTGPPFNRDSTFFKCPKLLIYHRAEAFDIKLSASKYLHLDRNRSLEIDLSSGWNDVTSGELHFRAATAGLRLQTSEATVVKGSLELSRRSEAGIVRFGAMKSGSFAKLRMPFNLEHEVNDISIKLEISYKTEKGLFFFTTTPTMSIMLPLGVNVQDVFKHKALFSKFTISSATSSPLRLLSSQLDKSDVFEAQSGVSFARPVVVYPRQPASMLYKITKLGSRSTSPRKGTKSSLSLILHYICLEEEVDNAVTHALQQNFRDTLLNPYARLVIPTVLSELRSRMSSYDLEKTAILSEVSTSTLFPVRWIDHFTGLGRTDEKQDIATLLADKVREWLQETPNIPLLPLSTDEDTISISRSIIIPVDVPSVTVVHTVDLILSETASILSDAAVAASNQPIPATLNIKWTRLWDTENHLVNNDSAHSHDLEFVYDVSGSTDTWLIGGKRKGHFKIPRNQEQHKKTLSFPVVLIPLREGFLPFPNVEIKLAPITRLLRSGAASPEETATQVKQPIVTCETDYKNAGETIRVISDARKTTVSLDASGPQGGAWLLETERRSAGTGGVVLG